MSELDDALPEWVCHRLRVVCATNGITTVRQAMDMADTEFLRLPNMGRKALRELRYALGQSSERPKIIVPPLQVKTFPRYEAVFAAADRGVRPSQIAREVGISRTRVAQILKVRRGIEGRIALAKELGSYP